MRKKMIFVFLLVFSFIHQSAAYILQDEASGKYLIAHANMTITLTTQKEMATDFIVALKPGDSSPAGNIKYAFAIGTDSLTRTKGMVGITAMLCLTCDKEKKLSLTLLDSSSAIWTSSLSPTEHQKVELNGIRLIMHGCDTVCNFEWLTDTYAHTHTR